MTPENARKRKIEAGSRLVVFLGFGTITAVVGWWWIWGALAVLVLLSTIWTAR
jgi:hypothetical protein